MTKGAPKGKVMLGFNAPKEMAEILDEIAIKRWGKTNRTDLLYEAVSQFIEREKDPSVIKEQMRQVLLENPMFLSEPFHEYMARQLKRK